MQIRLSPLVPCRQDGGDHGHLRRQVRLVLDVPVGVEDGRRPRCPRNLYGVVVYLSSQISIADTVGSSSDCSTIYL